MSGQERPGSAPPLTAAAVVPPTSARLAAKRLLGPRSNCVATGTRPEATVLPMRRLPQPQEQQRRRDASPPVLNRLQAPTNGGGGGGEQPTRSRVGVVPPRPGSRVASLTKSFEQLSMAEVPPPSSSSAALLPGGRRPHPLGIRRSSFRGASSSSPSSGSGYGRPPVASVRRTHSVQQPQRPLTAVQVAVRNLEARCCCPPTPPAPHAPAAAVPPSPPPPPPPPPPPLLPTVTVAVTAMEQQQQQEQQQGEATVFRPTGAPANESFLWTREKEQQQEPSLYGGSLSSTESEASPGKSCSDQWSLAASDKPYEDITWEMDGVTQADGDIRLEISTTTSACLPKLSQEAPSEKASSGGGGRKTSSSSSSGGGGRRRPLATFYVKLSVDGATATAAATATGPRQQQRRRRLHRVSAVPPRRPQSPPPLPPTVSSSSSLRSVNGSPTSEAPCPTDPSRSSGGGGERLVAEEPLYQFYQRAVVQRLWGSSMEEQEAEEAEGEEEEREEEKKPRRQQSPQHSPRSLWRDLPQVRLSGVLERLTDKEQRQQEALFEVLTSEASYQRSLRLLTDHFAPGLQPLLEAREWDALFGGLGALRGASADLLRALQGAWQGGQEGEEEEEEEGEGASQPPLLCERRVCDALCGHARKHGPAYVRYCSHQGHQERLLRELASARPDVSGRIRELEAHAACQGLQLHSFLLLPMQRITRLPLLADALLRHAPDSAPARNALGALNQVVCECNEGARKMARMEEMLHISRALEFRECRAVPLISSSRWLVKRGPLVRVSLDSRRRTWGRLVRCARTALHLFLFTDLLLVTKRKGDDYYAVLDHCPRNMVQACGEPPALPPRLPDCCRHLFQLTLLQNSAGRTLEMLLASDSESDKTRWMDVLTPMVSSDPDERIYEEWDCPQVQCRHAYVPQQPDELALEEADVVNVFRKMSDGWYEGERLRDGARGWFPASHTVELVNLHVRSRNLRMRYRLLMASQQLLLEQQQQQGGTGGTTPPLPLQQ
ncbi:ephexin isoform X3 [Haemaphysalis longicornis]